MILNLPLSLCVLQKHALSCRALHPRESIEHWVCSIQILHVNSLQSYENLDLPASDIREVCDRLQIRLKNSVSQA